MQSEDPSLPSIGELLKGTALGASLQAAGMEMRLEASDRNLAAVGQAFMGALNKKQFEAFLFEMGKVSGESGVLSHLGRAVILQRAADFGLTAEVERCFARADAQALQPQQQLKQSTPDPRSGAEQKLIYTGSSVEECQRWRDNLLAKGYKQISESTSPSERFEVQASGTTNQEALARAHSQIPDGAEFADQHFKQRASSVTFLVRGHNPAEAWHAAVSKPPPSPHHILVQQLTSIKKPVNVLGLIKKPGVFEATWIRQAEVVVQYNTKPRMEVVVQRDIRSSRPTKEAQRKDAAKGREAVDFVGGAGERYCSKRCYEIAGGKAFATMATGSYSDILIRRAKDTKHCAECGKEL